MLVLRRKQGEAIVIGTDIRVVLLAIEGGRVKVGIEAPTSISIFREELVLAETVLPAEEASPL